MNNVVITTLLVITGFTDSIYVKEHFEFIKQLRIRRARIRDDDINYKNYERKNSYIKIIKTPLVNIKIKRNADIIFNKNYGIKFNYNLNSNPMLEYSIDSLNINSAFNILKKFATRTNVVYTLEVQILESKLEIEGEYFFKGSNVIEYIGFNGILFNLTQAHFKGLSITASAETSTLSNATGSGEVQYIAMEVD